MNSTASMIIGGLLLVPALAIAQSQGSSLFSPSSSGPAASKAASTGKDKSNKSKSNKSKANKGKANKVSESIALNGRWQDSQCIPLAAAVPSAARLYVLRRYEFADDRKRWSLSADVFDNERCNVESKLLTYSGRGTFAVTGVSSVGKNVFDATFKPVKWEATPFSRDGTLALFNARCGKGDFVEGRTIDLGASGCSVLGIASINRVAAQNELVRVVDGKFFLGARSFVPGFADERPTQLSGYGLNRL